MSLSETIAATVDDSSDEELREVCLDNTTVNHASNSTNPINTSSLIGSSRERESLPDRVKELENNNSSNGNMEVAISSGANHSLSSGERPARNNIATVIIKFLESIGETHFVEKSIRYRPPARQIVLPPEPSSSESYFVTSIRNSA